MMNDEKTKKEITKITDLLPDSSNYNKHTQYGMSLLEKSMRKDGFVEAGLISEDNVICSGNARQETAINIGMEDVQIIDIDGTKPIYLRKKGLQSGTKEFKELALQLNAVGKANVVFDAELIEAELGEAVCEEWGINPGMQMPSDDELIGEDKNKPPVMKITFETPEQLQEAENDIAELIDRKFKGAFYSVSAGEI